MEVRGHSPEVLGSQGLKRREGPSPRAPGGSTAPRPLLREHVSVLFLLFATSLWHFVTKATHPLKIFVFLKNKTDQLNKAEKLYPRVLNLSYTVTRNVNS